MSSIGWLVGVAVEVVELALDLVRYQEWGEMESGRIDCCGLLAWKVGGMGLCVVGSV